MKYCWLVLTGLLSLNLLWALPEDVTQVSGVKFIGNSRIKSKHLKQIINIQNKSLFANQSFDRRVIKLDAISIKNYYLTKGFLDVAVIDSFTINDGNADIFFRIQEGKQYFLNTINLSGNATLTDKQIISIFKLKENKPYNPVAIQVNRSELNEAYHEKSKLFLETKTSQLVTDSVVVNIEIQEGPDVYINKIYVDGMIENLDSNVIFRELDFKVGDKYVKSNIDASQRKLMEIGIFSMAAITPVKNITNDTTVNLVIELRELNRREILSSGGLIAVTVNEGVDPVSALGGDVAWKDRRVFNSAANLEIKSLLAIPVETGLQYPRATVDVLLSNQWILGLRIPTELSGFFQSFRNYEQKKGFIFRYGFQLANILRLDYRSYVRTILRWELFDDKKRDDKNDIENRSFRIIGRLDKANNPLYPSRGYVLFTEFISVGGLLGGNRTYQKIDTGIQGYLPIRKDWTMASRIKYGMIFDWDEDYDEYETILLYDKFYLGGSSSLRAWEALKFLTDNDEDTPRGELIRLLLNWEIRFPIVWLLGGEIFLEGGQLTDKINNVALKSIQWGRGFGVTLASPLGPIRLDYGWKEDKPGSGRLNLGFLYIF
jgi:outer membrane protein insertion porin family